jgi:hypothetical protein
VKTPAIELRDCLTTNKRSDKDVSFVDDVIMLQEIARYQQNKVLLTYST